LIEINASVASVAVCSHLFIGRTQMKVGWIVIGLLAVLAVPVVAEAQGIVGGAQQGASQGTREGNKVAGPVGGAVGGVVGGTVGGVTGGVKGALGVSDKPKKKSNTQPPN
jgi:hypothetical protein